ncbi:DEAD/DEAH box helicase, partial [Verrucomicrobiota bacterium]
ASLRQRLGRSGRRSDAAVLRMFIPEDELTAQSHVSDQLRLEIIQCVAMVNLLLKKWYEPPQVNQLHLSTLVQQTLSVIGQYGGVRANQLWALLCDSGVFGIVDQKLYATFLRSLGQQDLISQTHDGQIVLGAKGERYVGHFTFYTAFNTPEEYRLDCDGKALGTLPIDKPLIVGQHIIFAGKRWEVLHVDAEKKLIKLKRAIGGKPPKFEGGIQTVHDNVRQEMFRIYREQDEPIFLNKEAGNLFCEGLKHFDNLRLKNRNVLQNGESIHIIPWRGDQTVSTITALLRHQGLMAEDYGGIIDIRNCTTEQLKEVIDAILHGTMPTPSELAESVENTIIEKHDWILSEKLRTLSYGSRFFDIQSAKETLQKIRC